MAILLAVDYWRPYLLQSNFTIKTDQKGLIHLDDQRLQTPWQHKALTKLLGLNYKIVYKKGHEIRLLMPYPGLAMLQFMIWLLFLWFNLFSF
jgi:hypothetical protein